MGGGRVMHGKCIYIYALQGGGVGGKEIRAMHKKKMGTRREGEGEEAGIVW